jgi:glycosyltransferase involved in cell wall biosynthesis
VGGIPAVVQDAGGGGKSDGGGGEGEGVTDGATGFLVPRGDAEGLASRIQRLATTPSLGLSCGTEGRRRALSRYSADRMVDDYFAVYERILGTSKERAGQR